MKNYLVKVKEKQVVYVTYRVTVDTAAIAGEDVDVDDACVEKAERLYCTGKGIEVDRENAGGDEDIIEIYPEE